MSINPFENIEEKNTYIPKINNVIEIWSEDRGRKSDTYISGLPLTKDELTIHLKNIKKSKGCNGSIKELIDENDSTGLLLHIQGNQKDYLKEYFNKIGYNNIKLKG
jgi:translation initiation factor 1 (eIF-1/SUI1)